MSSEECYLKLKYRRGLNCNDEKQQRIYNKNDKNVKSEDEEAALDWNDGPSTSSTSFSDNYCDQSEGDVVVAESDITAENNNDGDEDTKSLSSNYFEPNCRSTMELLNNTEIKNNVYKFTKSRLKSQENHPKNINEMYRSSRKQPPSSRRLFSSSNNNYSLFFQIIFIVTCLIGLIYSSSDIDYRDIEDYSLETEQRSKPSYRKYYKNEWSVKIESGKNEDANILAEKYGFINKGRIIQDDNYFLFIKHNIRTKSPRKARRSLDKVLGNDGKVLKLEQQIAKKRVKRDYQRIIKRHERTNSGSGPSASRWNHHYGLLGNSLDEDFNEIQRPLKPFIPPNDPLWSDMWYLHRSEQFEGEMDHNVKEAWQLGYTGKGVVVTILDDGLEHTHPDIAPNYDPKASFDVNDRDDDPTPRYDYSDENRHGTRCAGEVASVMNNSMCVVGIAYNSKIGGIRMLDGDVTDAVEAASLSHSYLHIDIYSASWGPDDDGRTVDGPATLTKHAFERGITYGRGGKGSIFIWASGNGGKDADSCNCDGYTNSIYTLSISSATEKGNIPWYSEACSSTLATAYSSGATGEKMIVTTDLHHSCTKTHTGTSASAPLAAGIAALTLEANPDLTWRDLQHIVVRTAKPLNLRAGDWKINGVGRNVSHSFGYGLLDAGAMVKLATKWNTVPQANKCIVTYPKSYKIIPHGSRLHLQLFTEGCSGNIDRHVNWLEHVQAIVTLKAPKRGDIEIYLISPKGTRSTLLAKRQRDNARSGFTDWAFMSTHNWGEPAAGTWILEIDNDGWDDAELTKWELVLHGTSMHIGDTGYSKESYMLSERSIDALHESKASSLSSLISSIFVTIITTALLGLY